MITRRNFDPSIKALLHFDYPYYGESHEACRDEINGLIFSSQGRIFFYPNRARFGYKCVFSELRSGYEVGYLHAENNGAFSINKAGTYEFEFFYKHHVGVTTTTTTFEVFTLKDGATPVLSLYISYFDYGWLLYWSGLYIKEDTKDQKTNFTDWQHLKVRLQIPSGKVQIVRNGRIVASGVREGTHNITEVYLSACMLDIDEFLFRKGETPDEVPSLPYQGEVDLTLAGGFGQGTHDAKNVSGVLNSYAMVNSVSGANIVLSKTSGFSEGSEIMLHVTAKRSSSEDELGFYAFRRIQKITGNTVTLDSAVIQEFNLEACALNYYVQAITVPHYKSIDSSGIIYSGQWNITDGGGIVVLRVQDDMTIRGKIAPGGRGPSRNDSLQVTHADMIDRFLIGKGGGVYITCGGTLSITGSIGDDDCATAGYGGAGSSRGSSGGNGNPVGYGSDSCELLSGGKYVGGRPGFDGEGLYENPYGGTCAVLIARKCAFSKENLHLGGQNAKMAGLNDDNSTASGGGTGFVYIACEESV